jgi:hypothetical protein
VAFDARRADWRTFRVDRITVRTPGGGRFTPRPLPSDDLVFATAARLTVGDPGDVHRDRYRPLPGASSWNRIPVGLALMRRTRPRQLRARGRHRLGGLDYALAHQRAAIRPR